MNLSPRSSKNTPNPVFKKPSDKTTREKPTEEAAPDATASAPLTRLFFYGADKPNGWLSQMHMSSFIVQGDTYVCNEQFFQHAKAMKFDDEEIGDKIMNTSDPKQHKALGKKVSSFDDEEWRSVAYKVVLKATMLKFTISSDADSLKAKLLSTGDAEIVEASSDRIWGCGLPLAQAKTFEGDEWPGNNLLGKAIMEVRDILRREAQEEQDDEMSKALSLRASRKEDDWNGYEGYDMGWLVSWY